MVNRYNYLFFVSTIVKSVLATEHLDTSMSILTETTIFLKNTVDNGSGTDTIQSALQFLRKTQQSANILTLLVAGQKRAQQSDKRLIIELDSRTEPLVRRLCGTPKAECNENELLFDGRYPYLKQSYRDLYLNRLLISRNHDDANSALLTFSFQSPQGFLLHQKRIVSIPVAFTDTCSVSLSFTHANQSARVKNHAYAAYENSAAIAEQPSQKHESGPVSTLSATRNNSLPMKTTPTVEHFDNLSDESFEEEKNAPVFTMPKQPVSSFTFIPRVEEPDELASQSIQEPVVNTGDGNTFGPGLGSDYVDDAQISSIDR
jgi:hypothetical protein